MKLNWKYSKYVRSSEARGYRFYFEIIHLDRNEFCLHTSAIIGDSGDKIVFPKLKTAKEVAELIENGSRKDTDLWKELKEYVFQEVKSELEGFYRWLEDDDPGITEFGWGRLTFLEHLIIRLKE